MQYKSLRLFRAFCQEASEVQLHSQRCCHGKLCHFPHCDCLNFKLDLPHRLCFCLIATVSQLHFGDWNSCRCESQRIALDNLGSKLKLIGSLVFRGSGSRERDAVLVQAAGASTVRLASFSIALIIGDAPVSAFFILTTR